ncbi:hypothetical protein [Paenibacillus hexagrammi]|uniref:Uncharacterized protein n=1 Tax=Paenibacillus hexagrammi TaxID=2908839 RepID=A0ABY3SRK6_9BACL|nr:hypothetical protein [Paenibacillus sp. YPD9-1]UJF36319.1 hypothetical protein L0M14_10620 [Paenibacillus sp. YPD9-1]UJF36320.1 hypothetical protein L0M14_10660 [Paenibacillus sp. YPD9-1]UJF36321.1 hypothetical protein L0M14_10670 [Paenibacillus sp. YPD9-1]
MFILALLTYINLNNKRK